MYNNVRVKASLSLPRNIVLTLVEMHEEDGLPLAQARKAALLSIRSAITIGLAPKYKANMIKARKILSDYIEKGKIY